MSQAWQKVCIFDLAVLDVEIDPEGLGFLPLSERVQNAQVQRLEKQPGASDTSALQLKLEEDPPSPGMLLPFPHLGPC